MDGTDADCPINEDRSSPDGSWEPLSAAIWAFVALGIGLRLARYALNEPIWGDEAFLGVNLIDRGYRDMLKPLDYHQVCPLFFLWIELTVVKLLGFSEASLRLFPMLCSVASVVLFRHVAGRVVRGVPWLLSVGIFAVSFYLMRYGTDAKPYASDLFSTLVLLGLALEWIRKRDDVRWLWALAVVTPIALGVSYPAVFMAGGLSLALAIPAWRTQRRSARVAYLAWNVMLGLSFLALFEWVVRVQVVAAGWRMKEYWANAFPQVRQPLKLLVWLVQAHTSQMFAYPLGGSAGASVGTTVLFLAGIAGLWKCRQRLILAVVLAPFGLGLLAAVLGRYPYGGSARTMQYVAPAICLCAGLGLARLLATRSPAGRLRDRVRVASVLLLCLGLGVGMREFVYPYKTWRDQKARDFARWFWPAHERGAVVACARSDLGVSFDPVHWEIGRTAVYLCNRAIYSSRWRAHQTPDWRAVSAGEPLRCVFYNEDALGTPAFEAWERQMARQFERRRRIQFVAVPKTRLNDVWFEDRYDIYEFVPRTCRPSEVIAGQDSVSRTGGVRK
jgi:hypothetical protein